MKAIPLITVVVCTHNRIRLLPQCLDALSSQTIREQIHIVVVDDGSTEDTASVVANYDVEYVVLRTNQGLSAARNAGISRVRGLLVAFTDDDVIVPSDWCEALVSAWRDAPSGTCAVGGTVTVANVTSLNQRYLARHNPLAPTELDVAQADTFRKRLRAYLVTETTARESIRSVFSLVGANMSFRVEALKVVGEFDSTIRFGGDEEIVCVKLRSKFGDNSVICHSSIVVAHRFDPHFRDTLRRSYFYGISNGRSWARDGGIPGLRPVGALSTVLFAAVAPLSILAAFSIAILGPAFIWRRWVRESLKEQDWEPAIYPLLALAQEVVTNVGFVVGWRNERNRLRRLDAQ